MLTDQNAFPALATGQIDPSSPLFTATVAAYWQHVHPLFPILHLPSFNRALSAGALEMDLAFRRLGKRGLAVN